jgi:hypothetical protein
MQCFVSAMTLCGSGSSFLGECESGSSFENECDYKIRYPYFVKKIYMKIRQPVFFMLNYLSFSRVSPLSCLKTYRIRIQAAIECGSVSGSGTLELQFYTNPLPALPVLCALGTSRVWQNKPCPCLPIQPN